MKKITCGIYLLDNEGYLLLSHETNSPMCNWGVPKGLFESTDTTFLDTAIRELEEETSIKVTRKDLFHIFPEIKYTKQNKYFRGFLFQINKNHKELHPVCDSMFECNGKLLPEIDSFLWIYIKNYFNGGVKNVKIHESQLPNIPFIQSWLNKTF
jgi:8-oxo-dGTP pyrophosphatase MutT (NUDIX family)